MLPYSRAIIKRPRCHGFYAFWLVVMLLLQAVGSWHKAETKDYKTELCLSLCNESCPLSVRGKYSALGVAIVGYTIGIRKDYSIADYVYLVPPVENQFFSD